MALFLTEADVDRLIDMRDGVDSLEAAFGHWRCDGTQNLCRQRMPLGHGKLNIMAASLPWLDIFGYKSYFVLPGGSEYRIALYSASEGKPLAVIEARLLSQIRTGAATAIATRCLSRQETATVAVIGCGKQARAQIQGVCAVRRIKDIRVYSRSPERRSRFAASVAQETGVRATAVESAQACVHEADIVVTCTNSAKPVFDGSSLSPGTHINAIGANAPGRTELDEDTIMRCSVIAVDDLEQAKIEAEELLALVASGRLPRAHIGEIGDIVQGKMRGRTQADEITLFRSLGIGLEDIALAACVFQKAIGAGVGRQVQT